MAQTKSTLSSVVSNLVRSSMGSSVPSTVTDDDLDRTIAELILKEAKQKAEKYGKDGIRAYLPQPESNAPRTNKRFLSSIIRSTDDHNKTILRAQAEAAEGVRQERREQEKRERRARAEEAVDAERMRRLMGAGGSTRWAHNWERSSERRDGKKRERSWERPVEDLSGTERDSGRRSGRSERRHRHHRSRSRSTQRRSRRDEEHRSKRTKSSHISSHHRSRSPKADEHDGSRRKRRREKERRRSISPDGRTHRKRYREDDRPNHSRSRSVPSEDDDSSHRRRHKQREESHESAERRRPSRSPTPGPQPRSRSRSVAMEEHFTPGETAQLPVTGIEGVGTTSQEDQLRRRLKSKVPVDGTNNTPPRRTRSPAPSLSCNHSRMGSVEPPAGSSSSHTLPSSRVRTPSRSPSPPRRERERKPTHSKPRPPSSSPPPLPPNLPSKMDKYFESSYDPRLDVAPLAVPEIPKTGLINDADFAGWDAMLELIRVRREDKAEKKRLERLGITKDKSSKKSGSSEAAERWGDSSGGLDIMEIEYKKRGSVREWDLGKEGF